MDIFLKAVPISVFLLVLVCRGFCVSQAALPTLSLEVGGRATGMGCAFVAVSDDYSAPHYNPAGLDIIPILYDKKFQAGVYHFHEQLLPKFGLTDLYHNYLSFIFNTRKFGSIAFSRKYISFGENVWMDELGRQLGTFYAFDKF